ncbi:MAG: hypothetical protein Q4B28_03500 [bacterium]|nr:hypothetical protein [bacterium]
MPAGAEVLYGLDQSGLSPTYLPNAKWIQIKIPNFTNAMRPSFTLQLQAPSFDDADAYKLSFISSYYQISGNRYPARTIGLRLVDQNYNPADEEKYFFCTLQSVRTQNPNISLPMCKALFDLYHTTQGATWKAKS